jgi:hypothetical protein
MGEWYFAVIGQKREHHQIFHCWVDGEQREFMPWPRVALIEDHGDAAMMYRYASDRTFAGDSWYENLDNAKAGAGHEYSGVISEWRAIPSNIQDKISYALDEAKKEQNQ